MNLSAIAKAKTYSIMKDSDLAPISVDDLMGQITGFLGSEGGLGSSKPVLNKDGSTNSVGGGGKHNRGETLHTTGVSDENVV